MDWHEDYELRDGKVFFRKKEIVGADAKSFRLVNYGISRDNTRMFFMGVLAQDVDPESYQPVEAFPDPTMPGVTSSYFRTRDGVFYDAIERLPRKLRTTGDPASFRCLADGYATDGVNIFYHSKKLAGARLADWRRLGHCFYASGEKVYNCGRKLKEASAREFEPLPGFGEFARCGSRYFHCWGPVEVDRYVDALKRLHVVIGSVIESFAVRGVKHMAKRPELETVDHGEGGWLRLILEVQVEQVLHNSSKEAPVSVGEILPVLVWLVPGSSMSPYVGQVRKYLGTRRTLFLSLSDEQPRDPSVLGRPLFQNYACLDSFNYCDRLIQLNNVLLLLK